jgi:site-specific recombinase XerD
MQNRSIIKVTRTLVGEAPILAWADSRTDPTSRRRHDLIRDKARDVAEFFTFCGKSPEEVISGDIKLWQSDLEKRGFVPSTIYAKISKVSSFYKWMMKDLDIKERIKKNPVNLARPRAPKAYQSESTKSLTDEELISLLTCVKDSADSGSIAGKRDFAILIHFALTGRRRSEVIGLRWGDLRINDVMEISYRVKGSTIETRLVRELAIRDSMLQYLNASGRLENIEPEDPLWTRHDRAGNPGKQLSSHAFAKNLKRYAKEAGIGDIHLHQLRHTFARIAGDESGSLSEVQEALGHSSLATTKIYLERVGLRKDPFSSRIASRLNLNSSP